MSTPESPKTIEELIAPHAIDLVGDLEAQLITNRGFILPRHIEVIDFNNRNDEVGGEITAAYNAYGLATQVAMSHLSFNLDDFAEQDYSTHIRRQAILSSHESACNYIIERPTLRAIATKFLPQISSEESLTQRRLASATFGNTVRTFEDALKSGYIKVATLTEK